MSTPIAEAFRYCPRCACASDAPGRNPFRCPACGFVHHFSPIAAVGAIIEGPDGAVLFVVRAKDPGKGKLGLPGGFVDAGETAEEALHREAREEANVKLIDLRYLISFPNDYSYLGVTFPVTDLFYVCRAESLDALSAEDGEIADFRLARPTAAELDRMAFESNRLALEEYLRAAALSER